MKIIQDIKMKIIRWFFFSRRYLFQNFLRLLFRTWMQISSYKFSRFIVSSDFDEKPSCLRVIKEHETLEKEKKNDLSLTNERGYRLVNRSFLYARCITYKFSDWTLEKASLYLFLFLYFIVLKNLFFFFLCSLYYIILRLHRAYRILNFMTSSLIYSIL